MATILITFIPHFEPEVQAFSTDDFESRPTRLLAAALKQWMFKNQDPPDEVIAIGVKTSKWQLLSEFVKQIPNDLPNLQARHNDSPSDMDRFVEAVSQASGMEIHVHAHEEEDDDAVIFEKAILRLNPLDQVVIDTTHGPVGLWMAFALLEKEHHLHEVTFQGFYGGRIGAKDTRFQKANAPESTRRHLALLDLTTRFQTQSLRNIVNPAPENPMLKGLNRFDEAVSRACPEQFHGALRHLSRRFERIEKSEDAATASFGRQGSKMLASLEKSHWDFSVLNAMWKRNDPLLFSRWAIVCLTHLSLTHHPNSGRCMTLFEQAKKSLENPNSRLAQWLYTHGAPLIADDIKTANTIVERYQTFPSTRIKDDEIIWMTSFMIRFQTAFHHVRDYTMPKRRAAGCTLRTLFDNDIYLKENRVIRMMADVTELQIIMHERGFWFGSVSPDCIHRACSRNDVPRYAPRWHATFHDFLEVGRMNPYLTPEEARGFRLSPSSDIASLGLVALESLQKSPVFSGDTSFEMLEQIRKWEIPDWSAVPMSPGLRSILIKCLKKDPTERFADAGALHATLLVTFPWLSQPTGRPAPAT